MFAVAALKRAVRESSKKQIFFARVDLWNSGNGPRSEPLPGVKEHLLEFLPLRIAVDAFVLRLESFSISSASLSIHSQEVFEI